MATVLADTVCDAPRGATTWEVIYNRLEDECPKITVMRATTDSKGIQNFNVEMLPVHSFIG